VGFMRQRADVGVAAPRTFNTDGTIQETARNFPSVMSAFFGRQTLLTRLFPGNRFSRRYLQKDRLGEVEPFQVQQVSGACMIFRRAIVAEVGPWDEAYFGYWVDTDWCLRLAGTGKKVFCVPAARVVHHESNQRGKRKSPTRIWLFHRGAHRLYRKHYTRGWLDPRAWAAGVALAVRAAGLMLVNRFLPPPGSAVPRPGAGTLPAGRCRNEAMPPS